MAVTAGVSPSSLPQSSTGRLEVVIVLGRLWRRMMISSRSSAAVRWEKGGEITDASGYPAPTSRGRRGD